MPLWPELSVKKLLPMVLKDKHFAPYFPDYKGERVPDKRFFWGIIFAIKPGFGKALVKSAMEQRNVQPQDNQPDPVKMLQI
jgi:hypothetical protein